MGSVSFVMNAMAKLTPNAMPEPRSARCKNRNQKTKTRAIIADSVNSTYRERDSPIKMGELRINRATIGEGSRGRARDTAGERRAKAEAPTPR